MKWLITMPICTASCMSHEMLCVFVSWHPVDMVSQTAHPAQQHWHDFNNIFSRRYKQMWGNKTLENWAQYVQLFYKTKSSILLYVVQCWVTKNHNWPWTHHWKFIYALSQSHNQQITFSTSFLFSFGKNTALSRLNWESSMINLVSRVKCHKRQPKAKTL